MATPLHVQISVTGTSQTLDAAIAAASSARPAEARLCWIQPDDGDVRIRDDGTNVSSTVGFRIISGVAWPYVGDMGKLTIAAASTGGATKVNLYFVESV